MAETNDIGNLTEAKVIVSLVEAGYLVSQPFGNGHKYDLVADDGEKLFRIQCKTGRVRNGVLIFNAYNMPGSKAKRGNYRGLADIFAVLNPTDGKVYLVPVNDVGIYNVSLRLLPTSNGQMERVRWAAQYELRPISINDARVAQW